MNKKIKKFLLGILFVIYLLFVFFLVFGADRMESSEYHYNLVPFSEIKRFIHYRNVVGYKAFLANIAGNFVVFMPFGFLLPALSKHKYNCVLIIILSLEFSLFIEILQLYTRLGSFDVDDLILNTTGGLFGYIIYKVMRGVTNRKNKKRGVGRKYE